jgi:hypothetical protein
MIPTREVHHKIENKWGEKKTKKKSIGWAWCTKQMRTQNGPPSPKHFLQAAKGA